MSFPIGDTLAQALRLYRLLFHRSVIVAASVYAVLAVIQLGRDATTGGAGSFLGLVWSVLSLAGPVIVEGILVALARSIHEGEAAPPLGVVARLVQGRFWRLFGAAIVYALGILGGFILLIVPGLIVLARWSLLAPAIVLENRSVSDARERSKALVRGQTGKVLVAVIVPIAISVAGSGAVLLIGFSTANSIFLGFVWASLTAPFSAHVLTAVYYRLAEPERPLIHP